MSWSPFLGKVVSKTTSEVELIANSQADEEAFDPVRLFRILDIRIDNSPLPRSMKITWHML